MTATVISGATGSIAGDNTGATLEAGEGALLYDVDHGIYGDPPFVDIGYGGGRSVWFKWTCPATGYYAFWTGALDGSYDFLGLGDSIVTVLDGDDFSTANVIDQNEYSNGKIDGINFPWSLVQFHATVGTDYWIAVDGYNGTKPSDGGYDINDTYEGPFLLHWGAAVCASPVIKDSTVTFISSTDTTATVQLSVNPQSVSGVSVVAHAAPYPAGTPTFASPAGAASGYTFQTLTLTLTGLLPNTYYSWYVVATNDCDNDISHGTSPPSFLSFYTGMPPGFGTCPPDVTDPLDGTDCTIPAGWSLSDGYRLQGNALGAYEWQADNTAEISAGIGPDVGMPKSVEIWVEIEASAAVQKLGLIIGAGGYNVVNDVPGGEVRLERDDAGTPTVLDTYGTPLADTDLLGLKFDNPAHEITGWVSTDAGVTWTQILGATDATYDTTVSYGTVRISQSAPAGPPSIDLADAYDLSVLGDTGSSAAIFPPFSCPDGSPKYSWHYDGSLGGDAGGGVNWNGPYYGGGSDSDLAPQACALWWLDMSVYVFGRIDCYNSVWNAGDTGIDQFQITSCGFSGYCATFAGIPFYPDVTDYASMLAGMDGDQGMGFYTFDSDAKEKAFGAIEATLDLIQAVFAGGGAYKATKLDGGGKHSYGVFMPVAVAPGRIDNFNLSYEGCATTTKRRPQIWRYR